MSTRISSAALLLLLAGCGEAKTDHATLANVEAELAERAKAWKARPTQFKSGYLWKYANEVGPARTGAVTHPGAGVEVECYADV